MFYAKLLHSTQTFLPEKASQMFSAERKMALRPTFSLYEIDPCTQINPKPIDQTALSIIGQVFRSTFFTS